MLKYSWTECGKDDIITGYASFKDTDIVKFIKLRRLRWAGHVIFMSAKYPPKRGFMQTNRKAS